MRRIGIDVFGLLAFSLWFAVNRFLVEEFGWPSFLVMVIVLYLGTHGWMLLAKKYPYSPKHGALPNETSSEN